MKFFTILFLLGLFAGCNSDPNANSTPQSTPQNVRYQTQDHVKLRNDEIDNNYHKNSDYKYEFRTGESGDYSYNYDINGYDVDGNFVEGNIDILGKYGEGYIIDEEGNERYINVEWVDWGVMEGTDDDGNTYEFEVDQ